MTTAVHLDHVSFTYDGASSPSITDITCDVAKGETLLLCGDSGCGKTTITRLMNGLIPHYFEGGLQGVAEVAGVSVAASDLPSIARHVGSVFQNPSSEFFTLGVTDELAFACENFAMPPEEIHERIGHTAHEFHIESLLGRGITQLSGGQKQKIACAAVSVAEPEIMVLDEPSSNLDARAIAELRTIVQLWRAQGKTVVIAEHRLYWLHGLIDRVLYISNGRIARSMSGNDMLRLDAAHRQELGLRPVLPEQITLTRSVGGQQDTETSQSAGTHRAAYEIRNFSYAYPLTRTATLSINAAQLPVGTATAVTGFNGAGKTTFTRCLQGLDRRCKGVLVTPQGKLLHRRERLSTCFTVLQDVNRELFTESVVDEVMLAQPVEDHDAAMEILGHLDLRSEADRHPMSLSGGQKQRVAIAAALASQRPIIIFDEPTSGLDMRHMRQVARLIRELTAQGRTVAVVTHDPEFALLSCDRNITIAHGQVTDTYDLDEQGAARLAAALVA